MMDLIDRGSLLERIGENYDRQINREDGQDSLAAGFTHCVFEVEHAPTIDAVPVVHGRWDDSGRYKFWDGSKAIRCTVCGCCLTEEDVDKFEWFYCPVCGARMDAEDEA